VPTADRIQAVLSYAKAIEKLRVEAACSPDRNRSPCGGVCHAGEWVLWIRSGRAGPSCALLGRCLRGLSGRLGCGGMRRWVMGVLWGVKCNCCAMRCLIRCWASRLKPASLTDDTSKFQRLNKILNFLTKSNQA